MKKIFSIFFIVCSCCSVSQTWNGNVGDSLWNPLSNANVFSIKEIDDELYVTGPFLNIGTISVNKIAKWNGIEWNSIGQGVSLGNSPYNIGKISNLIVAGGEFNEMGNVEFTRRLAIWDGINWSPPTVGEPNASIYDIESFDSKLFLGGEFTFIGGEPYDKIIAFDGTNWINVGSCGSWVRTLEEFNGELYAGGYFGIKKFNGVSSWTKPFGDVDGNVKVMAKDTFNNFLYVGGGFYSIGDMNSTCAAMWDGFEWNSLGDILNCDVYPQAMAIYRGDLYVGGCFDELYNGLDVNYIARWDGEQWNKVGNGFDNAVSALEVYQDELYAGGYFTYVEDTIRAYGIARWHMPDTSCNYIKPRVFTLADTFELSEGQVEVQFYNNNSYVDTWEWDFGGLGTADIKDPVFTFTDTGDFNIQVTVTHNSCVKTASKTVHIRNGTGMEEIENIFFKIYPNPSDGKVYVEVGASQGMTPDPNLINSGLTLRITGLNGHTKTIVPLTNKKTKINTNGWANGTYLVNLFIGNKLVRCEKLVIE